MHIHIRLYRAIDDNETCLKYAEGHKRVLEIFGISKITSAKMEWVDNPNVYVIIAESIDEKKLLGGVRVQVVGGGHPLPIEDAVSELDERIHKVIKQYAEKGTAELCGLWNSREVAGRGISVLLTRAGIAISTQLKLTSMVGICADLTLPMFKNVGYVIDSSVGNNGVFYYPKEDLLANAVVINAVEVLPTANPLDKERIFDLRKNPRQSTIEIGPKGELHVDYYLLMPSHIT